MIRDYPPKSGNNDLDKWLADLADELRNPEFETVKSLRAVGTTRIYNCVWGYIGGWAVTQNTIEKGTIKLDAANSYVSVGETIRIGDLNGFLDYSSETFGIGIGVTDDYLTYDTTNGLRIKGSITVTGGDAFSLTLNDLDDISDGTNYGRVLTTSISAGLIVLSECSGDLDDIANGTYGKVLTTAISAGNITLTSCVGDLDDISNGTTYGRVNLTSISAGNITLVSCVGDLDDITDGTNYGRVATTSISAGQIVLTTGVTGSLPVANSDAKCTDAFADQTSANAQAVAWLTDAGALATQDDLDGVPDGATYGRVNLTSISAGNITLVSCVGDLDDIADGTYGKVLSTSISAGRIVLTAGVTGSLPVANSDAKCTDPNADQTSVNTAANASAYTGASISVSYTAAKCTDANADQTSANPQNLGWVIGSTGSLTISASGKLYINTTDALEIQAAGNILVKQGGDIVMEGGTSGNPSLIRLTDHTVPGEIRFEQSGSSSAYWKIKKQSTNDALTVTQTGLTQPLLSLGTSSERLYNIGLYSSNNIYLDATAIVSAYTGGSECLRATTTSIISWLQIRPNSNKARDLGNTTTAWDDVWADDFQNVADFYNFDDRDDIAAIQQIKGSGIIDPLTGYELIDDDTLPEWLLKRYKKDGDITDENGEIISSYKRGDIARDPDGKPHLSLKTIDSLLLGAVRQLDNKFTDLEGRLNGWN